jgi:hypothetical protein
MKVRFLTPAEIKMFEASAYYEMQATDLGSNFLDIIEEATNEIKENPRAWRKFTKRYGEELCAGSRILFCIVSTQMRSLLWQLCIRGKNRITGSTVYRCYSRLLPT